MSHHWWLHGAHAAKESHSKGSAVFLIIIGIFFALMLLGIPLIILGMMKLCKS